MKDQIKIVQCDKRGQLVIPKKIRLELGVEEGAAFWVYKADDEIRLKKIESPEIKIENRKTIFSVKPKDLTIKK